jgi:ferric-dicitrate binding protein FerR (iron transport regulator)
LPRRDAAPSGSADAAGPAVSTRIVYFEGEVLVDGKEPEFGMELGPIVAFKTGPGSFCDVVFNDKNAIRIGNNTVATVDFSKPVFEIDLERGGAAAVLRKLAVVSGDDSFRVRMQNATAGVRGTSFCVWDNEDGSYVCACNGSVRTIDSAGGNQYDLVSAHHTAKLYVSAGKGIEAVDAGLLHHDDASVEALAARIGETIDWTTPDRSTPWN